MSYVSLGKDSEIPGQNKLELLFFVSKELLLNQNMVIFSWLYEIEKAVCYCVLTVNQTAESSSCLAFICTVQFIQKILVKPYCYFWYYHLQ